MTELSAAAKAILDAGQTGLSPSAATKAGVLQGVESNLAGASASVAASSATTSVLSLKLVLGVVAAVGIGGGLWLSRTNNTSNATSNEATVAITIPDKPAPVQASPPPKATTVTKRSRDSSPSPEVAVQEEPRSSATITSDKKDEKRHSRTGAKPAKATGLKSSASRAKSTLADEQKLIAAAQIAIRKADYSAALTLLKSHSTDFPTGILAPERKAATAIAQCMSGQGGKAAGRRFLDKYSQSPLAARVRTSCKLP